MREQSYAVSTWVASWRTHHWVYAFCCALYFAMYAGVVPAPQQVIDWFANRPEVAQAFADPHFGRADALILVFSTIFLGPLALLIGLILFVFVVAIFGGLLLPMVQWFRLPEWTAIIVVLGALTWLAWYESNLWLPHSLWFLGMFARAVRIVVTY